MPAQQDPSERPEDLETRPEATPSLPGSAERPEWLVGSEDVLQADRDPSEPTRPTLAEAPTSQPRPMRVIEGGKAGPSKGWSGASSSVPRLTVVPTAAPPDIETEEGVMAAEAGLDSELPLEGEAPLTAPGRSEPVFQPLQEPWYLVWGEAIATQRRIQVGLLVVAAALSAYFFLPRPGEAGASLGNILRHPETYEGRSVVVRGEVLETFEVGTGRAFQLRQGRDVVVVYSTVREPRPHDRVEVHGIVSTGYLDGKPRVAIFEGAAP